MQNSDNVWSAENQQERLKTVGWIVGFVDGEGCFSSPIYRCHKMTLGWQVRPEFAVVQGASSRDVLEELRRFFECGKIFINRRRDNHKEDLFRYCVQRYGDLVEVIVPFFRENSLRTSKKLNFEKFSTILEMMGDRKHLSIEGMIEIAKIAETMNHRKPSELLRILRDHTPALSLRSGRGRDGPSLAATRGIGEAGSRSAHDALASCGNGEKRNSLSGKEIARRRSDPTSRPAHNGEAHTGCLDQGRGDRRRVMPWEALCVRGRMAP